MNHDGFFKSVKAGDIRPVYLFVGEERYIKRQALKRLSETLLPEGMEALNETTLDGGTAAAIIEAAETLPFMGARRLVVVYDFPPLLSGRARDEAAESERMIAWLEAPPPTACVVFFMSAPPDGRKKLTAALKKRAEVVEFNALGDGDVLKWLNQTLRPLGKSIDREAASRLIFLAGRYLSGLSQEIDKLSAYVGARAEITAEDVDALVAPSAEATVFQMIDELMGGRAHQAHERLKTLLTSGESALGVVAMLTRQFRLMTHITAMRAAGQTSADMERTLSTSRFVVQNAARQAARFDAKSLSAFYRACVEADHSVKSGRARDDEALYALILSIQTRA